MPLGFNPRRGLTGPRVGVCLLLLLATFNPAAGQTETTSAGLRTSEDSAAQSQPALLWQHDTGG